MQSGVALMPVDPKIFHAPATQGDVAAVAINVSIGLRAVLMILQQTRRGAPIGEHEMAQLENTVEELGELFNALSGWKDE